MIQTRIAAFFGSKLFQVIIVLSLVGFIVYEGKAYHDQVYSSGVEAGIAKENNVWVERENKRVADNERRIKEIEKNARELADANRDAIRLRDQRITELNTKLAAEKSRLNTVVYRKDGTPNMSCPSDTQIFLGTAFSQVWNTYNAEIFK